MKGENCSSWRSTPTRRSCSSRKSMVQPITSYCMTPVVIKSSLSVSSVWRRSGIRNGCASRVVEGRMRICVFYDEECSLDEFLSQYPCQWDLHILRRPVHDKIRELAEEGKYDIYFNLCDGPLEGSTPGLDLVQALEEFNLPFTGANSQCYDPLREEMQSIASAHGISFANGLRVEAGENVIERSMDLRYPIMVKHPKSFGSIQMF